MLDEQIRSSKKIHKEQDFKKLLNVARSQQVQKGDQGHRGYTVGSSTTEGTNKDSINTREAAAKAAEQRYTKQVASEKASREKLDRLSRQSKLKKRL